MPLANPEALVDALVRLGSSPARRRAMGQAARQRALAQFSLGQAARRFATLYEALHTHRPVPSEFAMQSVS